MKRWISSALITLLLLAMAFALPLWAELPQNPSGNQETVLNAEIDGATLATTVAILQQRPQNKKVSPSSKPLPPDFPTVPTATGEEEQEPPVTESKEEKALVEDENDGEDPMEEVAQETELPQNQTLEQPLESGLQEHLGQTPQQGQQGKPGTGSNHKAVEAEYRQYVLQRIAAKKTYPRSARSKEQEGRVRVSITLRQDGSLGQVQVIEASQHSLLNEASLVAVQKAAPFKKMPAGMESLSLTFSMDYSLAN